MAVAGTGADIRGKGGAGAEIRGKGGTGAEIRGKGGAGAEIRGKGGAGAEIEINNCGFGSTTLLYFTFYGGKDGKMAKHIGRREQI